MTTPTIRRAERVKPEALLLAWMRDQRLFARTLKTARLRAGIGLRELARDLGIAPPTITRIEQAMHSLVTTTFEPLAAWLLAEIATPMVPRARAQARRRKGTR